MSGQINNTMTELKGFLFEGVEQTPSIIIYSSNISKRLRYVCRFIFNQGLLCNFVLIDSEKEFLQSKLFKINYSIKTFENALNIYPSEFLNETGVRDFIPENKQIENLHVFFPDTSDFGFDIFASVFYFISRYEEWQSFAKDNHGRFEIENSILKKLSIHKTPIVDFWIQKLKHELSKKYKTLEFSERGFKFISTIDVDNVFAYKSKPWFRQSGGALKDLMRFDFRSFKSRLNTIVFGKKDPFDEYEYQIAISKEHNVALIYFFLCRSNTNYDRSIEPNHPEFLKLLKVIKNNGIQIGLHPSYYSSQNPDLFNEEQKLLSINSDTEVISSRQHFLRFNIQTTPKQLIKAGIQFDFTMGFASVAGFRAGTSLPFYYYDFDTEVELNLMAVPFAAMDGAYYVYEKTDSVEAYNELMELAATIKTVNGLFITVIHDRSFSEEIAPGWKDLYKKLHESLKW